MPKFAARLAIASLSSYFTLTATQATQVSVETGNLLRDLDTCVRMVLSPKNKPQLFPNDWFLGNPHEHISTYFIDDVLVARKENQTVGMITFNKTKNKNKTASINLLVVDESHQRQGIGSLLMQKALTLIKNSRTILSVYKTNTKAIKLYKKFGFFDTTDGGIELEGSESILVLDRGQNNKPLTIKKKQKNKDTL